MRPVYALVGGLVLAVAVITAAVILGANGDDVGAARIVAWSAPFIAALLLGAGIQQVTSTQNQKLDTITEQTNGQLDARILSGAKTAVKNAIAELGAVPAVIVSPPPPIPDQTPPAQHPAPSQPPANLTNGQADPPP